MLDSEKKSKIDKHYYKLLDHGLLRLVDYMGSDQDITDAARVSYRGIPLLYEPTKTEEDNAKLIRYLMRHRHTSPFEMCEVKLHVKLPIFVARQWIRHRTASVNEQSGRYSELMDKFYTPETESFRGQSKENKQGSAPDIIHHKIISYSMAQKEYQELLSKGVAKEMARIVLPLSVYTQWYWKIDLHNLLHFLQLRLSEHAQEEIRVYAQKIALIVKDLFPITWQAFEDYRLNAITFSAIEKKLLLM